MDDETGLTAGEEEALALELLGITTEEELGEFIGKLLKKAWRGIRRIGRRVLLKVGKSLLRAGRSVLSKALPIVGGALGSLIPIPGVGTAVGHWAGTKLGSVVRGALSPRRRSRKPRSRNRPSQRREFQRLPGNPLGALLGGEMEFTSDYEAELEFARRVVRSISQAARRAVHDPHAVSDPAGAVSVALRAALEQHLPLPLREFLADGEAPEAARRHGWWVSGEDGVALLGA